MILRAAALASAAALIACAETVAEEAPETGDPFAPIELICDGVFAQGGFAICTLPEEAGHYRIEADVEGAVMGRGDSVAFIPIERDAAGTITVTAEGVQRNRQPLVEPFTIKITPREWDISRIDGLPPSKVTPRTPEEQAEVEADWLAKQDAWEHRALGEWWLEGFTAPITAAYRTSGVFGSQRILNGEPGRVHSGLDYAAPEGTAPADFVGTDVVAPAGGVVALADPDMYFEGGFVVLDHGMGLMSLFMHMSEVSVETGQEIAKGQRIGAVGSTGRSTGPHLHWGVRSLGVYVDPAALLSFDVSTSAALASAGSTPR